MEKQVVLKVRWQIIPILSLSTGVAVAWGCAIAAREALGAWQYGVYVGGLLALASVLWLRRRVSVEESHLKALRSEITAKQAELAQQRRELDQLRKRAEAELRRQAMRIDQREQQLARQLVAYHELADLPSSIDLSDQTVSDEQLEELVQRDRRMIELLESESRTLFEKIRCNEYSVDGRFQPTLLRDDAYALISRVARVYQPDARQPLLETSIAQILRAASRVSLHFLAVLDGLPLDVKQYNVSSLYGYVQQAVKAYGVYKTAAPYFPYVNMAYQMGRMALGAHPVSSGAWWFVGAMSKKGASALATRIINRQALVLLHDLVRVIGFEVANLYGGDFRHRDANWIYAAELTELISRFPLSRESLSHGLKEISALLLRSEYDRIFLYRLLAEHKSARPERFRGKTFLTAAERQAIAARLERFLETFVQAKPTGDVQRWREAVEGRLNVKVTMPSEFFARSVEQQTGDAIRSLAGFLLEVKQYDPAQALERLGNVDLLRGLEPAERQHVLGELQEQPPFFFEQPDLDPVGEVARCYLNDLVRLAVRTPPYDVAMDDVVAACAAYLRRDAMAIDEMFDKESLAYLRERFAPQALPKRISRPVVRAVLSMLESDDQPRFLYGGVAVEAAVKVKLPRETNWLLGTADRLIAFSATDPPTLLWRGDRQVHARRFGGFWNCECRLTGGQWLADEATADVALCIPCPTVGNYEKFFRPLLESCRGSSREAV